MAYDCYVGNKLTKDIQFCAGKTNCLTHIPNDINLELKDGVLTLKAGSKVYVPNGKNADGSNRFDELVLTKDLTITQATAAQYLICVRADGVALFQRDAGYSVSGAGVTTKSGFAYDTELNLLRWYNSSGELQDAKYSLPICLVTGNSSNTITSIDQVFNGFGYIGSTGFILPRVKGLIPNGFNEDGTYKSIEWVNDTVLTYNNTQTANNGVLIYVPTEALNFKFWHNGTQISYAKDNPKSAYTRWYNQRENKWYYLGSDGTALNDSPMCILATGVNSDSSSPYKITSLTPNPVQTNNLTRQIKRVHKGTDLVWIKDKFIMEQRNTGTYTLNIEFTGKYRILFVGNGAGGGSGQRDSKWFQSSGGSGACFEGVVKLTKGTYTVTLGTLGYGYNKDNTSDLTGGVDSTDSYLTDSNGNELIRVGCGARGISVSAGGVGGTLTLGTIEVLETIKAVNGNQGNNINNGSPSSTSGYALSVYDNTKTGYGAGTGSWRGGGNVYGIAGILKIEVA